jgi:hypothetical protein
VRCLAATCGHLRKRSLLAAAGKVAPLLRHHSAAVRHSAVAFIAAAARALPPADVYTQLAVMVAPLLQQQPLLLTGGLADIGCLIPLTYVVLLTVFMYLNLHMIHPFRALEFQHVYRRYVVVSNLSL